MKHSPLPWVEFSIPGQDKSRKGLKDANGAQVVSPRPPIGPGKLSDERVANFFLIKLAVNVHYDLVNLCDKLAHAVTPQEAYDLVHCAEQLLEQVNARR